MPTVPTARHGIEYPDGDMPPNVPADMQRLAESVDAALDKITGAPIVLLSTTSTHQTHADRFEYTEVLWNVEDLKQGGMKHSSADWAAVIVPEDGVYEVSARVGFITTSEQCIIGVSINGIMQPQASTDAAGRVVNSVASIRPKPWIRKKFLLQAGDTVRIHIAASTAYVGINQGESWLEIEKTAIYN